MSKNSDRIKALEAELAAARAEAAELKSLPLAERLAILLHDSMCSANHTDQCGWLYEIDADKVHDFTKGTHDLYLKRAQKIINTIPVVHLSHLGKENFLLIAEIILKGRA